MKNGIKLILRYLMAVAVWGLLMAACLWCVFTFLPLSYLVTEQLGPFIAILLSTISAAYCLPKEQRSYLGGMIAVWIVIFGLFTHSVDFRYWNYTIMPALVASLFHYLNDTNLCIRYGLGIAFVLFVVPFLTAENNPESGLANLFRSFLEINVITNKFLILIWTSSILIYFGTTIACAYLLPIPHRLYFGLSIAIFGIIPRFFSFISSISLLSDGGALGKLWAFGSFALGVIAADLLLYRQQKTP